MTYLAAADRYQKIAYRRSGRSGVDLPAISLGLWQNFGGVDSYEVGRAMLRRAFDRGVCHFDLANNYGPPFGSAEENFGRILEADFRPYRDELFISTTDAKGIVRSGTSAWCGRVSGATTGPGPRSRPGRQRERPRNHERRPYRMVRPGPGWVGRERKCTR